MRAPVRVSPPVPLREPAGSAPVPSLPTRRGRGQLGGLPRAHAAKRTPVSPKRYPHVAYGVGGGGEWPVPGAVPGRSDFDLSPEGLLDVLGVLGGLSPRPDGQRAVVPQRGGHRRGVHVLGQLALVGEGVHDGAVPGQLRGEKGRLEAASGTGTRCPLPLGEACGHALCAVLIFISPQVWWRGVSHPAGQWCLFWSCWVLPGGLKFGVWGGTIWKRCDRRGWAAASSPGLAHRHLAASCAGCDA